ncbi:hypothetical protein [Marinobacter sp.]|uniref:hypothetical protein n=1 Tax=Marinobacter sp. TaxID=50741 RepID=UPI0035C6627A
MRSLTKLQAFDAKVVMFLDGQEPQTVCNVAIGLGVPAQDARASLHRLTESGQVLKVVVNGGPETFRLSAGGFPPDPKGAA